MDANVPTLLLLLGAIFMGGCDSGSGSEVPADRPSLDGQWILVESEGRAVGPGEETPELPGFTCAADGKIHGFTGLNRFQGQLDQEARREGRFAPGPMATTRRAGPPEAMDLEQRFLVALDWADFEISGDELTLRRDGAVLARLKRAP